MKPVRWQRWNGYLLVAGAAHFALVYTLNTRPMLDTGAFERGLERAPFQYRVLTAWIYAIADHNVRLPAPLVARLPPSMGTLSSFMTLLLAFVSLVTAVLATRFALERLLGRGSPWAQWGALLVLPMGYFHYLLAFGHPCCTPMQLPYDLPSLAFFAICLALIMADRLGWLTLVFTLATLNRESTIFLVLLLGLYRSASQSPGTGLRLRRIALPMAGLTLVWLSVRFVLHRMLHPPPPLGPTVAGFEIHIADNLGYLLRPYYWTSYLSLFGFTWLFVYTHWREVPHAGVRRMLWIGPVYLLAMYIVGVLSEIRIFGELIPLYAIAFTLLLHAKLPQHQPTLGTSHQN